MTEKKRQREIKGDRERQGKTGRDRERETKRIAMEVKGRTVQICTTSTGSMMVGLNRTLNMLTSHLLWWIRGNHSTGVRVCVHRLVDRRIRSTVEFLAAVRSVFQDGGWGRPRGGNILSNISS